MKTLLSRRHGFFVLRDGVWHIRHDGGLKSATRRSPRKAIWFRFCIAKRLLDREALIIINNQPALDVQVRKRMYDDYASDADVPSLLGGSDDDSWGEPPARRSIYQVNKDTPMPVLFKPSCRL